MAPAADLVEQLLTISRDFEPRLLRELRARGHEGLRPTFGRFLYLVWSAPMPLHTIAEELGITRQAASQMAARIERAGYAERRPNPASGRSKVVVITDQGRAVDDDRAQEAVAKCEAHYAAMIGEDPMHRLVSAIATVRETLDIAPHPASARRSLGVLPLVALHARDAVVAALHAAGHDLTASQLDALVAVGHDGARPVDLARRAGVSRQAASATLQKLEELGIVGRGPDASDQRGVVFSPTRLGARVLDDRAAAVADLEARFRDVLGDDGLDDLRDVARRLVLAIDGGPHLRVEELAASLLEQLGPDDVRRLAALLASSVQ